MTPDPRAGPGTLAGADPFTDPITGPLAEAAATVFARLGGTLVDPPTLIDADIPLDLSGEAVRSRLCVFTDARGRDIALRPDLTLPIALAEAQARKAGETGERVCRYVARAFRLPAAEGFDTEFTQVGFERYGAPSGVDADIETFAAVLEAAQTSAPDLDKALLGDLAVFPAVVDAVTDDPVTADSLKRRFRQGATIGLEGLEDAPSDQMASASVPSASLADVIATAEPAQAEALVREMLTLAGVEPVGARGLDEIVERLMAKSANARFRGVSAASRGLLRDVLGMAGPARKTADALAKTVKSAGLDGLDPVLDRLSRRLDALADGTKGLPLHFGAGFGRRFTYYDGFLFELFATGESPLAPLAAGGRYDRLIADLSDGAADVTAIGGVVRPDRMALASQTPAADKADKAGKPSKAGGRPRR
ncbi:MAG: ATP phosphoribosyltransferase regulatory subunit [Pseudomonadota bacterium]